MVLPVPDRLALGVQNALNTLDDLFAVRQKPSQELDVRLKRHRNRIWAHSRESIARDGAGWDKGRGRPPASIHCYIMPVPVGFRMRLLLIVGGLCCGMAALGQTEAGSIAGSVFDPAHAPAAGVSVEARNTETGTDYKAVSSAKGVYTLMPLPPGKYDIFVIDPKYRPFVRRGVAIR